MHVNLMINSQFRKNKTSILIMIKVFFLVFHLTDGLGVTKLSREEDI